MTPNPTDPTQPTTPDPRRRPEPHATPERSDQPGPDDQPAPDTPTVRPAAEAGRRGRHRPAPSARRRLLPGPWRRLAALVNTLAIVVIADGYALTAAVRRRLEVMRARGEAGLTTVEVAIITAVLLGLATALAAAITAVVNRNTSKIK